MCLEEQALSTVDILIFIEEIPSNSSSMLSHLIEHALLVYRDNRKFCSLPFIKNPDIS